MSNLKVDLVFLFSSPLISDPLKSLHFKFLESLLKHLFSRENDSEFKIHFLRLRFLSDFQLKSVFKTLEDVCSLVGISLSNISLKFEDEDLFKIPDKEDHNSAVLPTYTIKPKSEFETEMCNIIIPLLKYKNIFDIYGIEGYTNFILYGLNSGNIFIDWFRSVQSQVNTDDEGNQCSRTLQLSVIRLSDILMPYYGESEQKLKFLFEFSIQNALDGVLCICLEGLHNLSKDSSDDLERRILSTLLLLLDGISQKKPICDVSVVVVGTTEEDPSLLDESLLRPGRLHRILEIVE